MLNHLYESSDVYSICEEMHVCEICGSKMEIIEYKHKGLVFTSDIFHNYTKHNIIMNKDVENMIMSDSLLSLITKLKLKYVPPCENHVFDHVYLMACMHR